VLVEQVLEVPCVLLHPNFNVSTAEVVSFLTTLSKCAYARMIILEKDAKKRKKVMFALQRNVFHFEITCKIFPEKK